MPFKTKLKLTENQSTAGYGNIPEYSGISGFAYVGAIDSYIANCVATGSGVDFKYRLQTLDIFNNIIDLHTGDFSTEGNHAILVDPNPYEYVRILTEEHSGGYLNSSLSAKRD